MPTILILSLLLLVVGSGSLKTSKYSLAIAPYQYNLAQWEISHFMDKWFNKLGQAMPWYQDQSDSNKSEKAQEFFTLNEELRDIKYRILLRRSVPAQTVDQASLGADKVQSLDERASQIKSRIGELQAETEEAVESQVSAVISREGFAARIGLIFPPVDTVFSSSPHVLIVSPRDRILRQDAILLTPDIADSDKERLEGLVLQDRNLSAIVEGTGGVASYPSVVADSYGIHHALTSTAHEWLHHWFFWHPLGWNFSNSPEMTALNETAATMGGNEIGDAALTAMTGQVIDRSPRPAEAVPAGAFDFNTEMRLTRLHTEELLSDGKIDGAESYMAERTQFMVANGYAIRKINQAYFAFYGSYAASAGSISPIDTQLKELRSRSNSLGDFLRTVAQFGTYQQFLDYLSNLQNGP